MSIVEGNRNLLKLAGLLEARSELSKRIALKPYDQTHYTYDCGSPGCALGLWLFSHPEKYASEQYARSDGRNLLVWANVASPDRNIFPGLLNEFYLSLGQFNDLFGTRGCNAAQNEFEAAAYIRAFVARHGGVPEEPKEVLPDDTTETSKTVTAGAAPVAAPAPEAVS